MTGLEADVPQAGEKGFNRALRRGLGLRCREHEQIDVGKRKQLATAEASDRIQRQRIVLSLELDFD